MAESLLFRKGLLADLEKNTPSEQTAGAISFTTDEPAIYIDVQEGESVVRKRIGDLIVVDSMANLMKPLEEGKYNENSVADGALVGLWSTTALYYVEENEALLKWNGSKWSQLNALSDIETEIKDTIADVNALNSTVAELSTAMGNKADKGVVDGLVTAVGDDSKGLVKDVNDLKISNSSLVATVGDSTKGLVKDVADLEATVGEVNSDGTASGLLGRVGTLETAIANKVDQGKFDALSTTVGNANSGLVKDVTDLKTAVGNADSGLVKDVAVLETVVGDADSGLVKQVNALDDAVNNASTGLKVELSTVKTALGNMAAKGDVYTKEEIGTWTQTESVKSLVQYIDNLNTATNSEINNVKDTISGASGINSQISGINGQINDINISIQNLGTEVGNPKEGDTSATGLYKAIDDETARATAKENEIAASVNTLTTGQVATNTSNIATERAERVAADTAHNTAIQNLNNAVGTAKDGDTAATGLYKLIEDETNALRIEVNNKMQTADAMTFKGVVNLGDDGFLNLPTEGVEAGHTYKVGVIGKYKTYAIGANEELVATEHGPVYVGDLLIAMSDQGDDANYYGNWAHVSSGYEDDYDPKLSAADNKVKLTNSVEKPLGEVTFVADNNSNVTISTNSGTNTITVGMVWGTF